MQKHTTRIGLWIVRRNPRLAARLGWTVVKHPRRTAIVVAAARQAPRLARRGLAVAKDPDVQQQVRVGRDALAKAARRLRDKDARDAVADEKLRDELRRAAAAMASGYAAASHPKKRRRRRIGRAVVAVGIVGAGAYAGYRAVRQTRESEATTFTAPVDDRDETLAASFPASDPPAGPAA
jgi:hypothetical protein